MNPKSPKLIRTHSKASHVLALHELDMWHHFGALANLVGLTHLREGKRERETVDLHGEEAPRSEGVLKHSYGVLKLHYHLLHQVQALILLYRLPQVH